MVLLFLLLVEAILPLLIHVPDVAHVPQLTMQLISTGQIVDSGCRVILDTDSCSMQDRHTGALLGASPGVVTPRASGSLTGFTFPPRPPPLVSPPLLPRLPAFFSSGVIVLVTCVALVSRH
jgi:hypothetical protein